MDEPHLHGPQSVSGQQPPLLPYPPGEDRLPVPPTIPPPQPNYNQPPPNLAPHNALLPDPYMAHRIPMYPHQQGPHYGPPRFDRPQYPQTGYRGTQIPRSYNGPPRPMRGMHHREYSKQQIGQGTLPWAISFFLTLKAPCYVIITQSAMWGRGRPPSENHQPSWVSMNVYGYLWVSMGVMGVYGYLWVFMDFYECWVFSGLWVVGMYGIYRFLTVFINSTHFVCVRYYFLFDYFIQFH